VDLEASGVLFALRPLKVSTGGPTATSRKPVSFSIRSQTAHGRPPAIQAVQRSVFLTVAALGCSKHQGTRPPTVGRRQGARRAKRCLSIVGAGIEQTLPR